jgi:hypothetical protein
VCSGTTQHLADLEVLFRSEIIGGKQLLFRALETSSNAVYAVFGYDAVTAVGDPIRGFREVSSVSGQSFMDRW